MADLVDYLGKLNAERAHLQRYSKRIRIARWILPGTVKQLTRELEERWAEVTKERERTLEVIWADPVLRQKMKDLEAQAVEESRRRLAIRESMAFPRGKPYAASKDIRDIAVKVIGLEREEAFAQYALDEANFYYGSGAWQNDGIEVGKLKELLDHLTVERDRIAGEKFAKLDGLTTRLQIESKGRKEPVSMVQHKVLESVRAELPQVTRGPAQDSPLAAFLRKETPRREEQREPKKKLGHSR